MRNMTFFGYTTAPDCPHCGSPRVGADYDDDYHMVPGRLGERIPERTEQVQVMAQDLRPGDIMPHDVRVVDLDPPSHRAPGRVLVTTRPTWDTRGRRSPNSMPAEEVVTVTRRHPAEQPVERLPGCDRCTQTVSV